MRGRFCSSIVNIFFILCLPVCVRMQEIFEPIAVPGFDKGLPYNFILLYSQVFEDALGGVVL
jgi:hypothetical protein